MRWGPCIKFPPNRNKLIVAGNRASWIRGPSQTTFSQAPNQALTTMPRCVHRRRERGLIFLSTQVGEMGVGCPATPAQGRSRACPVSAALCSALLCTPFSRPPWQHAPEHPPGPSLPLLAGPVAPAAGQSPPIGRPAQDWHWATGTGTGTDWPPCCSHLTGRLGEMARTSASAILPPLPTGLGSGSQAPTHRYCCCTRSAARAGAPSLSPSLLLSHSVGRSGLSFFLCCRPLSSLSFFPSPNLPYTPSTFAPFPREIALSVPRVRMNLPHSWSVSSSLPYPPPLNLLVPRGASSPRPRVDSSILSS